MAKKVKFIACALRVLPDDLSYAAAVTAMTENPVNRPLGVIEPKHIGVLATKYWGAAGVDLAVAFMENTAQALADRILSHMNSWQTDAGANVRFRLTAQKGAAQVRISRGRGGYWSYLGTDVKHIPVNQPTMNLEGFTMSTPEGEYRRVVRHETGHTLGFPHEHTRRDLVALLDPQKTIAYFQRTQGWSQQEIMDQVLTPIEESSLVDPTRADGVSIMCYQLPGACTRSGEPIPGGNDLDALDKAYAAKTYPGAGAPPPPDPGVAGIAVLVALDKDGKEIARFKPQ